METLAYKLTWLSKWKLQCESSLGDPSFTKLIGHYSVYQRTAQYLNDHDDSSSEATAVDLDYTGSGMEDFDWPEDASEMYSFSSGLSDDPLAPSSLHDKTDVAVGTNMSSSVVVSEDEIQLGNEDDDDSDPFSDPEANEFSSDEEDTSSDSSVEELEDRDCPPPPSPKTVCEIPRPTRPRPRIVRCP
ncbi:hypothetical protein H2204_004931 [Knufia peltigerae]|uniref:Uncharacterized protein n=1 Tax=Knufia peltigerae TaxID=1002370 RepID=A0AA38Y6B8_9EURO|nr:hypothetical protein H2204_004931 [Knufia peltigerae]